MQPFDKPIEDPEGRKIIGFADDDKIEQFYGMDLYGIFCREVLEFEPDEILLTDESSLHDFPEEEEYYISSVKTTFNIDISDMDKKYICDILQRVLDTREPKF